MADVGMPETLTPQQMQRLGGAAHPDDLPDTLTPDQMERATEKPQSYPPTEDERLGIDTPLANPRGVVFDTKTKTFHKAAGLGTHPGLDTLSTQPSADYVPERPLIKEDPAMNVATTIAGGGVGKVAGKGIAKLSPIAAKLFEPAIAGATTSALQGGDLKQNLTAGGIGMALGIPGAALTAIRGAPAAVSDRLATAITGGTRTKAAKQVVSGAVNDVLDAHPELKKVLVTSTDPVEKERAVEGVISDLRSKAAPYYSAIDTATAGERRAAAEANVSGLSGRAAEAKRAADELAGDVHPTRDLFEEARKIDAPPVREPDLREAARQIDAPVSRQELANQGRERVAGESAAEAERQGGVRAAADTAQQDADRLQKAADSAISKLQKSKAAPGIDISAIDKNLDKAAVRLAKEGRGTEALAVGRGRKQLAELYGDGKVIPPGTVLPAQSVRTLATDLGDTAFAGDTTTEVSKKALAQRRIYGAVTREIERAAERAGIDVSELKDLNKQMSSLIPARTVLGQQRVVAGLKGPEDPLSTLIKKPAHVAAGIVNGIGSRADYFLSERPTIQRLAAGAKSPLPDLANRALMAGTAARGAQATKPPAPGDLEYAARVSQGMKNGLSLQEAVNAAEQQ